MAERRYLLKRRQTWYVRVTIPPSLRRYFKGRGEIVRTLGTRSLDEARRYRWNAIAQIKNQIDAVRPHGPVPTAPNRRSTEPPPLPSTPPSPPSERSPSVGERQDLSISLAFQRCQDESRVADKTRFEQRKAIEQFLAYAGDRSVKMVDRRLAGAFISEVLMKSQGKREGKIASAATVNKKISSLSTLWRFLVRRGYLDDNPWADQGVKGERSRKRPYTWKELSRIMAHERASHLMRDVMTLAVFTGLRIENLAALRTSDIEEQGIHIREGKTENAIQWLPLSNPAWEIVARRAASHREFIFHELASGPWEKRSQSLSKQFGRFRDHVFGRGSGEEIDFHSFRRVFAWAGEQVTDAVMLARLMGHAPPTLATRTYSAGAFRCRMVKAQQDIADLILTKRSSADQSPRIPEINDQTIVGGKEEITDVQDL